MSSLESTQTIKLLLMERMISDRDHMIEKLTAERDQLKMDLLWDGDQIRKLVSEIEYWKDQTRIPKADRYSHSEAMSKFEELVTERDAWKQSNDDQIELLNKIANSRDKYKAALEELSRLGNGDRLGNSIGNIIAQRAFESESKNDTPQRNAMDTENAKLRDTLKLIATSIPSSGDLAYCKGIARAALGETNGI